MNIKVGDSKKCYMCKKTKPLTDFYKMKKGYYSSRCKPCDNVKGRLYFKTHPEISRANKMKWRNENPWSNCWQNAKTRCTDNRKRSWKWYGGKGIKVLATIKDFKTLWFRDKAYLMSCPSIDRIDSNGHYSLENCRFIEKSLNASRTVKGVMQLTLKGKKVKEFASMNMASDITGVPRSGISAVCHDKQLTSGGYKWQFTK